jgi:2-amino-4-hydroxy-6-hydroxymethyldihydropteridine diphosphokinase
MRPPAQPDTGVHMVALALGGNLGDPEAAFLSALQGLEPHLGSLRLAPLYRSEPISPVPQPAYLNTALLAETRLDPWQLLGLSKALELAAGRRRLVRHGPRQLDIDMLLFDDLEIERPELQVPHRHLRHRRFFLAPLAELLPDLPVPPGDATVAELLAELGDEQSVEKIEWSRAATGSDVDSRPT